MKSIVTKTEEAKSLIREFASKYKKIAIMTSFGKDSMVALHLVLHAIPYKIDIVTIMTPFKPVETFVYKDLVIKEWELDVQTYASPTAVSKTLPQTDPNECCRILKEEPTKQALMNYDAWITGLRRTEGNTRTDFKHIEVSDREFLGQEGEIVKVNPILDWYEVDVWKYIAIHQIPVHPFYVQGYRSLGCLPCTHLVDDSATERSGRWKGTSKCGGECGIHTMHKSNVRK